MQLVTGLVSFVSTGFEPSLIALIGLLGMVLVEGAIASQGTISIRRDKNWAGRPLMMSGRPAPPQRIKRAHRHPLKHRTSLGNRDAEHSRSDIGASGRPCNAEPGHGHPEQVPGAWPRSRGVDGILHL
jgi:hypothetical protein